MTPTIEQILSAAHADDDSEPQPMTLRQLRDAIDTAASNLVSDDVPVLVRVRALDGATYIGILDALTHCEGGGVVVEAIWIESSH